MNTGGRSRHNGAMPSVLVVDDDRSIRDSLERALRLEGFDMCTAATGEDALIVIDRQRPQLVVLDIGLPGIDGVEVISRVRSAGIDVPICVLSARDEIDDRVAGLEVGADDYLVKPFALEELVARMNALLRRRPDTDSQMMTVGDLRIEVAQRRVTRAGAEIALTRREFHLLETLARNQGVVLSRDRLLELVWGYDFDVHTNVVDVFVGYLRRKLEAHGPRLIHTVRGIGFVMRV